MKMRLTAKLTGCGTKIELLYWIRGLRKKDDMKIPLALTYHPAMHKVYEILRKNQNVLLVDKEHKDVFKDKMFVTFRKAKSLKD